MGYYRLLLPCAHTTLHVISTCSVPCRFYFPMSAVATPTPFTTTSHPHPQVLLFKLWEHTGTQMVKPILVMSGKGVCGGGLAADGTEGIANQPTYTHIRTYTGK